MSQIAAKNSATGSTTGRKPIGASVGIPPRRIRFNFDQNTVPAYFFDNSAFKSTMFLAMSATFPEGELFFVKLARQFRDKIKDPKLSAEISGFIGQEALHSQAHIAFDEAAEKHGFSSKKLEQIHGKSMKYIWKKSSPKARLAFTAGIEHLTAILTETFLRKPEILESMSPEVRDLFLWHSVEETEHKSVAFDVYHQIGGDYATRALMMVYGVGGFIGPLCTFKPSSYVKILAAST